MIKSSLVGKLKTFARLHSQSLSTNRHILESTYTFDLAIEKLASRNFMKDNDLNLFVWLSGASAS
jgi:hypothetical protein